MKADPIGQSTSMIIGALGWILLAGTLSKYLHPIEAAVALFGVVMAEILSRLLADGLPQFQLSEGDSGNWDKFLSTVFLRWILLLFVTLGLVRYAPVWFFEGRDYAVICILGLVLSLTLLRLIIVRLATNQKRSALLIGLRNVILAAGVYCVAEIGLINGDLVLPLALALSLGTLVLMSLGLRQNRPTGPYCKLESNNSAGLPLGATPNYWLYADLIVLSCVLTPQNTFVYLIARGLAQVVPLCLQLVSGRIARALFLAFEGDERENFVAIAARTNLGYLLIGGGASLFVLSAETYISIFFDLDRVIFRDILFWLLVAQASPVFFGATAMLLDTTRSNMLTKSLALFGMLIFISSYALLEISEPKQFAQVFASSHVLIAAISAGYLGFRFGVWPGLTAVFFRQIKLL